LRTVLLRALAPLALMGLIFHLSAQSDPGADIGAVGRVLAHAGEYALLTALWAWALGPALGPRAILAAAAVSLLYAVTDEIHQSTVPGRDADPLDVAVDAAGIVLACVALRLRPARAAPRPSPSSPGSGPRPS
jgi:VanZ family protein